MSDLKEPWLVAAWPGMGQVGITAAFYLLSKLRMHQISEFRARDLFELEDAEIKNGILRAARLPRSRLFLWQNPRGRHDVIVFIGEAQPPTGKLALCSRLVDSGRQLGAQRVLTFASITTEMEPRGASRVFGVATGPSGIEELRKSRVEVLEEGRITGLNGVFLAAAAEAGLPGIGLLGEMPAIAPQVPFPNASAAVLRAFARLAGIDLDLDDLEAYGSSMQEQLGRVYDEVREAVNQLRQETKPAAPEPERAEAEPELSQEDFGRIERLFTQAELDRAKAFELKRELDRLGVFSRYEDRFLDIFEKKNRPEG